MRVRRRSGKARTDEDRIELYGHLVLWNGRPWPALMESLRLRPLSSLHAKKRRQE